MSRKATEEDFFSLLNTVKYKSIQEVRTEVQERGLEIDKSALTDKRLRIAINDWTSRNLVEFRERSIEDRFEKDGYILVKMVSGYFKAKALPLPPGKVSPILEYKLVDVLGKLGIETNRPVSGGPGSLTKRLVL